MGEPEITRACRSCCKHFTPTARQTRKHDYLCVPCDRAHNKAYRARRKAMGNPVKSGVMTREYRTEYGKKYYADDGTKKRRALSQRKRSKRPLNMAKDRVRARTRRAIARGELDRKNCEVCGDHNTHAHHSDYNDHLSVMWLCPVHHAEWHKNNDPIAPKIKARGESK